MVRPPTAPDTVRIPLPARADSILKTDSTTQGNAPPPPKPDTIQPLLARPEAPPSLEIGGARIYDRPALFATGSLTLSDLLGRLPGLTSFATGWIGSPATVAALGDMRRIRIYLDGIELDPMDLRSRGVAPLSDLPLYALEELRIERGADEVRVYATSWRVDRTTAYTRADIGTGDQNTNLYRGYFGQRYRHGEALQFAAEQYSTQPNSRLPQSDQQRLMLRLGLTRGPWSGDLFAERADRLRSVFAGQPGPAQTPDDVSPGIQSRRTTAYARLGNGDPESPRWLQLIASAHNYRGNPTGDGETPSAPAATVAGDSTTYESQYLLTGGLRRGPAKISAAERIRVGNGHTSHIVSGRASYLTTRLALSLLGEGRSYLDPSRLEGTVRVTPIERVALSATASHTGGGTFDRILGQDRGNPIIFDAQGNKVIEPGDPYETPYDTTITGRYRLDDRNNLRADAGVRLGDVWIVAGIIQRGATTLLPPADAGAAYGRRSAMAVEEKATARTLALRGRLWRAVNVDAWAVQWNDTLGLYRPKYQTRGELFIQTNLLNRFPRGNFGLLASLAHEYRSKTRFQISPDSMRVAEGFRNLDFRLEIRIQTAVVSYQFRNVLQQRYAQVPGFLMARQTQFYGLRWEFWN